MTGWTKSLDRCLGDVEHLLNPAASLRASAATFRAIGQDFSADWSEEMADAADVMPALYHDFARQQRERAARLNSQGES